MPVTILSGSVVATMLRLEAAGLNVGTTGNVSARTEEGCVITPSGVPAAGLTAGDIVRLDRAGRVLGSGVPSSEWRFHVDLYRARSDVAAVVHTHSTYATALACTARGIPAFHYMVAAAGGADIRCAPYATFGTAELSAHVLAALADRRACLLANHGVVATGADLAGAATLAEYVEHLARAYTVCLQLGGVHLLDGEEMARVVEKFTGYGTVTHGQPR